MKDSTKTFAIDCQFFMFHSIACKTSKIILGSNGMNRVKYSIHIQDVSCFFPNFSFNNNLHITFPFSES
jgi:hypothetical protein